MVVGVVKEVAVSAGGKGTQDSVIKNALQTVAVARFARKAQEVAGEFKVRIRPARRLEMVVGAG